MIPRLSRRLFGACTVLMFLVPSLHAQPNAKIPDPDPELERKSLIVADGFEVNLFAADPLLAKPIQMNFDSRGRLWVACSETYPQIKPERKANDKILVLEDTKRVGQADKVTVFADGLLIPMGVAPGDGGAYVASSTELLHFSDPGPDGKARKRRVVLSGFGTEDSHHIVHALRWGPDGMLYFNQSIYINSNIETPYGVRRLLDGGIWQYRPETMRLEVYARGFWNGWGEHFDRWGQWFATDGANGEGINYLIRGASYPAAHQASRMLHGLNPGSPKQCGCEITSGRHLPPEWRGNVLTNDFRGHRVCRFVLRQDGSGYASQEVPEVIRSSHPAFRPVDVKMGPDGAIYIADWYNPIIQHGEIDFRDPRRDVTHGRIWRVTAKGRPLVSPPALVDASTSALLEALKAPEDWTRHHAKRLLKERGTKVLPELAAWIGKLDEKDVEHEHHLLEALWTYQTLDTVEPKLLSKLLQARDYRVRAAATRVLTYWHDRLTDPLDLLAPRIADEHPQVRLEAVRALGEIPSARAAEVALRALDKPLDPFLDYALWQTVRESSPRWLPALEKGRFDFGGARRLVFALQAVSSEETAKLSVELIKSERVPKELEIEILALIAAFGGPSELAFVFGRVPAERPNRQASLLNALEQSARQRHVRPAGDVERLGSLLSNQDEAVRAAAARLAGLWNVEALRPKLVEMASLPKTGDSFRQACIDGLVAFGDRKTLEELTAADRALPLRRRALIGLAAVDLASAATRAVELLTAADLGDPSDLFAAFVAQKRGGDILARALASKTVPAEVAKAGIRIVRTSGTNSPALVAALTTAGGLSAAKRALSAKELRQLVADVQTQGKAARGEAIFRRHDLSCLKCHAIAGAGGQVGPDLTSIGASAFSVDYLVEAILLPNKSVKQGFETVVVSTKAGKTHTGIKVREAQGKLVLRSAEDREEEVPLKDIEEVANGISLMPEGLADSLTRGELIDLVRFLSELGKVGPFQVRPGNVVRRWQALEQTRDSGNFLRANHLVATIREDPALVWTSAYSDVSGTLPLNGLPINSIWKGQKMSVVRCHLNVTTGGKVCLRLDSVEGLTMGMDESPIEAKEHLVLDLSPGRHTLTIAVDRNRRTRGVRCELEEVPGSTARASIVGGK